MTARLLLVAIVALIAAGVAGVAVAAAVVSMPMLIGEADPTLSPGSVSLMGAAVALAYGLLRPRKQAVREAA
jgi:hypothetical protein